MSNPAVNSASSGLDGPTQPELPQYPRKRLIICCDGTWNAGDIDGKPLTNVARIARCISNEDNYTPHDNRPNVVAKNNYISQIVHYQPGVGIGTGRLSNIYDAMSGRGLSKSIREAYTFICLNKSDDLDQVVLIGFSRGAFAVRCVAQFMEEVGLLTKCGLRHLPKLFRIWKRQKIGDSTNPKCSSELDELKRVLEKWGELRVHKSYKRIEACAVWDTVSAIGFPVLRWFHQPRRSLYLTVGENKPENIQLAIQALALDEKRRHFVPMVWNQSKGKSKPQDSTSATSNEEESQVIQCWFAGNHADVGGGNVEFTLANMALAWMIGQLTDKIEFDRETLWAITTTRSWSMPSPIDNVIDQSLDHIKRRTCKVTATSPVSLKLLRSTTSWSSFFQRTFGGSKTRIPRSTFRKQISCTADQTAHKLGGALHYSVHVFDHLGIADYQVPLRAIAGLEDNDGPDLPKLYASVFKNNKPLAFEGDILKRWAKHELCAHVNIRQSRSSREKDELKNRPSAEDLRDPSYEASVPISAILSAVHELARQCQPANREFLKDICEDRQSHQSHKPWDRSAGNFVFQALDPQESVPGDTSSRGTTYKLKMSETAQLVFEGTFPNVLIGRPHDNEERPEKSWMRIFRSRDVKAQITYHHARSATKSGTSHQTLEKCRRRMAKAQLCEAWNGVAEFQPSVTYFLNMSGKGSISL